MPDYAEQYLLDQLKELYDDARLDHESRYVTDWFLFYRHYKNYVDRSIEEDDYHSNIGVGLAFPLVEIVHARLMEPWLAGNEIIDGDPTRGVEDPQRGPNVCGYINHILQRVCTMPMAKMSLMKKSGLCFGRGVLKYYVRWRRPQTIMERVADTIAEGFIPGGMRVGSRLRWKQVPVEKHFEVEYVDPFNFMREPGVRSWHKHYTFERNFLNHSEVTARQESKEWRGIDIEKEEALGYDEYTMRRLQLEEGWTDQIRAGAMKRTPHQAVEFNGRIEVKSRQSQKPKYQDMTIVMLNEQKIVKKGQLSTWDGGVPYIEWEPTLDPGSERPIGLIEPIEDQLLELNDYVNIALDNARKLLESPLLVDKTMLEQETLFLGPGEINNVRNPHYAVKQLDMKDLPASFYHFIGYLNDLVQRISGVSDYFGGLNTSDTDRLSKTATGMTLMAHLSASRFGPALASLDRDCYRKLAEHIHQTSYQRMTEPVNVRLPNNPSSPYATVAPDDLDIEMDYAFNAKALDPSAQEKRQQFVNMMELLGQMVPGLQMQGWEVDHYELARILMDEFGRGAEVRRVLRRAQQLAPGMVAPAPGAAPIPTPGAPGLPGAPAPVPGEGQQRPAPVSPASTPEAA